MREITFNELDIICGGNSASASSAVRIQSPGTFCNLVGAAVAYGTYSAIVGAAAWLSGGLALTPPAAVMLNGAAVIGSGFAGSQAIDTCKEILGPTGAVSGPSGLVPKYSVGSQ
jgi:hypothetical protein